MNNEIRIPVRLSPHIVGGRGRGFYLIIQRLFLSGSPLLRRNQFIGFNGKCLFVTAIEHGKWDTLFGMARHFSEINGKSVIWLSNCRLNSIPKGFRVYIPGTVLKPSSADAPGATTTGILKTQLYFDSTGQAAKLWYLEVPEISAEVLLGEKELKPERKCL